jgi:hypothetical protein
MQFQIPLKEENPVCSECRNNFPQVYHSCMEACGQLVNWASQNAQASVNAEAARSANSIRELNAQREALRTD